MSRLKGKRAFITAAGQGIGKATALAYVREGAEVIATDINADTLATLKSECPDIETRHLDVLDSKAVAEMGREVGTIDVLFNCAGYVHQGTILECSEDDYDFSSDINVKSMYRTLRAFLPGMLENGGGSVINMSSGVSSLKGVPNRFIYGVTKAAVIGLTKAIAADFVKQGIRCNAICPGTVQSPSLEDRINALPGTYEENRANFIARQPMGRLGTVEEVAALAVYLGCDESAFVTGGEFKIDGGWTL